MSHDYKVGIYKGIIQYLLDATNYSLQRIANLSNSPIAYLQLIYHHNRLPQNRSIELNLLKLFVVYIDMEIKREQKAELFFPADIN
ncbi:hypothetical protein SCO11_01900 [Legionella pneumophila serogroup 1]|uniref:hypothetical protein n=1 Tax=Legionella pneumophila TaxID=446 RepID=UPI000493F312|nr:hypothetical protein [Legionella pneumophila]HAT8829886.1 hypothetical protein [Legionella pneumophila subsp. pneumophila]MCZ4678751.1 hypothetical protein [Legionella pneumophila]MCZ4703501.1 hypothetical protein [Legionella pneumophila]MCZ4738864.1 hypothetical protein [Legionella pneumophila]MCZ4750524.1 hypothetical protein [Legionella pneumophila]